MESEDFDYEISNKLVNDYLNSIGLNDNFDGINQVDENIDQNKQIEIAPNNELNRDEEEPLSLLAYFFPKDLIINFLSKNEKFLTEAISKSDIDIIVEENLNIFNKFKVLSIKSFIQKHKCVFINSLICFFSIFVISFLTSFLIIVLLLLILILIYLVFKFSSNIFSIYCLKWLDYANSYILLNRKIISYIKRCDLIDLNIKRRYLIESKKFEPKTKDLNFTYRKTLFLALRSHFFILKELNIKFTTIFKIDDSNLICSMDKDDLSIVMNVYGSFLDKSTDNYSIQCISSLAKLNSLILSENFKLIILSFYQILKNTSNIFKFISFLIDTSRKIKSFKNNINELEQIFKLVDRDQCESKNKIEPIRLEENLSHYIRNALLISYEIVKIDNKELKFEMLKNLKINIEYCNLYLEQLESDLGFCTQAKKNIDISKNNLDIDSKFDDKFPNEIISENDVVEIEDEIFEAENDFNGFEDLKLENGEGEELSLKQKQEMLNTKNLFYELKFALKPKTNEWNQREKNIKKKQADTKNDYDDDKFEHLLENDVMLYKSNIKKQRRIKKDLIGEKIEPKRKYKYEEVESENEPVGEKINLLNELLSMKNFRLQLNQEEEILSD